MEKGAPALEVEQNVCTIFKFNNTYLHQQNSCRNNFLFFYEQNKVSKKVDERRQRLGEGYMVFHD